LLKKPWVRPLRRRLPARVPRAHRGGPGHPVRRPQATRHGGRRSGPSPPRVPDRGRRDRRH